MKEIYVIVQPQNSQPPKKLNIVKFLMSRQHILNYILTPLYVILVKFGPIIRNLKKKMFQVREIVVVFFQNS